MTPVTTTVLTELSVQDIGKQLCSQFVTLSLPVCTDVYIC